MSDDIVNILIFSVAIMFFIIPPILLIIRAIKNIKRTVKKSEDVQDSGDNYFLKLIMDILLLIIVIIRLRDSFKFRCYFRGFSPFGFYSFFCSSASNFFYKGDNQYGKS